MYDILSMKKLLSNADPVTNKNQIWCLSDACKVYHHIGLRQRSMQQIWVSIGGTLYENYSLP
jgi:hypothetical protein